MDKHTWSNSINMTSKDKLKLHYKLDMTKYGCDPSTQGKGHRLKSQGQVMRDTLPNLYSMSYRKSSFLKEFFEWEIEAQ